MYEERVDITILTVRVNKKAHCDPDFNLAQGSHQTALVEVIDSVQMT
jgi:hypothetical protein